MYDRIPPVYRERRSYRGPRTLLVAAKYITIIFTPFYLPLMGMVALFLFSYLSMMPWLYKLLVLLTVWLLTVFMPTRLISLYQHYQGWPVMRLLKREERVIPYVISILCYLFCFYLMKLAHTPHFMSSIVMAAIAIQIVCALINNWWKISIHSAAIGGTTGAVIAFSLIFGFNPIWWLAALILLAGILGTARLILRHHTLWQITGGYLIGVAVGYIATILC